MAEEDIKRLLEENLAISKESLKILKGIRRHSRIAAFFKIFYWLIILGSLAGAYYYLQPYIIQTIGVIQKAGDAISGVQKAGDAVSPDLLKNLENVLNVKQLPR